MIFKAAGNLLFRDVSMRFSMKKFIILILFLCAQSVFSHPDIYVYGEPNDNASAWWLGYNGYWGMYQDNSHLRYDAASHAWVGYNFEGWVDYRVTVNGISYYDGGMNNQPPVVTNEPPVVTNTLPDMGMNLDPDLANTVDPINVMSGNNHFSVTDIVVPAPGIPLVFRRYYNSINTHKSVLGKGWTHSYEWSLAIADNTAIVTSPDAETYTFYKNDGIYSAAFDKNWQLTGPKNGEYALSMSGGIVYRFNTNGVLKKISDGWNNTVTMTYSNEALCRAEHSNGQSLTFSNSYPYGDSSGTWGGAWLDSVSAATNLSVAFGYGYPALCQAGSGQRSESYNYYSGGNMRGRLDAAGSSYSYFSGWESRTFGMYLTGNQWYHHEVGFNDATHSSSRVEYRRGAAANLVCEYDYTVSGRKVTNKRWFFANRNQDMLVKQYISDDHGDIKDEVTCWAPVADEWTKVSRDYDGFHNVTSEWFELRLPDVIQDTPYKWSYTWHPQWQTLTSITDPEGFKKEYEYINGAISKERITLSGSKTSETTYNRNANGLVSTIVNANGHSIAFTYNTKGYLKTITPQAGPTISFGCDSLGHLTNSTLPGGRQTGYTVNPLGWVERIDYADNLHETFQYNGLGDVTNHVDRAGRTNRYEYLPGGKLQTVRRQFGSTNVAVSSDFNQQFQTRAVRDELNRSVESYALDGLPTVVTAVTNLEGQTMSIRYFVEDMVKSLTRFDNTTVSNKYNGAGQLTGVSYPGETNNYTYLKNGLVQTLGNSKGSVSNAWNGAGWLTKMVSAASSVTSAVNYAYDLAGNVTNSSVNLQSAVINRKYTYDKAERLTNMVAVAGTSTQRFTYAYNADNGMVSVVSNKNLRAEYQYDIMDRITSIDWKNAGGATILAFDYQYNAAGMITNRVLTRGSGSVTTGYGYDDLDRLTSETENQQSEIITRQYSYDLAGNRLTKTGGDFPVNYSLGIGNRLASWDATSTNDFASFRTLEVRGCSSEPIGTDSRWGQLYVSNSVAVTPDINGTNFSIAAFTVGMGAQKVVAAIRDQAGNMGYATNEIFLTVVTNGAYQYNVAGCVTNIAYTGADYAHSVSLGWNSQYQLTSAGVDTNLVQYSYDVASRRISRTEGTNVEQYVYDGTQVIADLDGNGNVLRTYTWGLGIDNLLSMTTYGSETNVYYALKDHLNTVHALIDATGQIVERYEYDAWGRTTVFDASGKELSSSAIGNRYCFQGRETDWKTGLYHFRARTYDPVSGRWLSNDPIGISGGLNQYVFCGNSPVNATDPSGLDIIYLLDSNNKLAAGNGHAGILIGSDATGWIYMSYGPYKQGAPINNLRTIPFATLNDAIHSSNSEISRYDRAAWYRSTPAQDQLAVNKMEEYRGKQWKSFSNNCNDAATAAMQAAGTGFKDVSWKPYENFWYNFWNTPGMVNGPNSSWWN